MNKRKYFIATSFLYEVLTYIVDTVILIFVY